ncbi:1-acyl-sn-glycerol-3-phosphate acyltransferase [Treponema brennaborense]|uniref:Phospholipid/glycerol acyltransferase n=1 Tax=Treponema brennaborense (strain DSM 12168 / CIP 105900 / DD5/3) TaxID=906968 RepID=F4LMA6_TREBD|nr:1-acyl-sn-glycerol-3-phosphate acyltransferase [Treponema brennaborense]AEE17772.1 phospholipid/glycerol acyltransferase [Treponema brennaborense DSM 12168]
MTGIPLGERYKCYFGELAKLAQAADKIDETNVYQAANPGTRKIMDAMLKDNLLDGSRLEGCGHFKDFLDKLQAGKRGLILMEHYSNMDLPALCYLLEHDGGDFGTEVSNRLVAIAGMKLNEANPMVKAWAEGFTRIVIYPSRSLAAHTDPDERAAEEAKSRKINMASMRAMDAAKRNGQAILVFPSGTRYRPGKPETKRGLREIDSYLRMFDVMILVSINGNCLRINPAEPENMLADLVVQDVVIMSASPVIECKKFRNEVIDSLGENPEIRGIDPKQKTVDRVMELLDEQHARYDSVRRQSLEALGRENPDAEFGL